MVVLELPSSQGMSIIVSPNTASIRVSVDNYKTWLVIHVIYTRGKKDIPPYYISPIEMRSLWQTITCIKSPSIPLNLTCVCWGGWDLSKEVLWVSVGQLASKLQAVNVRGLKKILPIGGPRATRVRISRSAEFFSNLEHWQLVILMPVDLQRPTVPLWKGLELVVNILAQETARILKISFTLLKWPNLHRVYFISSLLI